MENSTEAAGANPVKKYVGIQERILEQLGSGMSAELVSQATGASPGYISQLLAEEEFSRQVIERRCANLTAASARDRSWDSLEDALLDRMKDLLPLMYKPMEVIKALSVINGAKRRGVVATDSVSQQATIVQLNMPTMIVQKFVTNNINQVVQVTSEAGKIQTLVTMPSGQLRAQFDSALQSIEAPIFETETPSLPDLSKLPMPPVYPVQSRLHKPRERIDVNSI